MKWLLVSFQRICVYSKKWHWHRSWERCDNVINKANPLGKPCWFLHSFHISKMVAKLFFISMHGSERAVNPYDIPVVVSTILQTCVFPWPYSLIIQQCQECPPTLGEKIPIYPHKIIILQHISLVGLAKTITSGCCGEVVKNELPSEWWRNES